MTAVASKAIGIIAGNGLFPMLLAREARRAGRRVVMACVRGDTHWFVPLFADTARWFRVGDLERLLQFFHEQRIEDVAMAGQVNPAHLFRDGLELDPTARTLMQALKDRKADTIFSSIAAVLEQKGLRLINSVMLLTDHLAPKGTWTRNAPTTDQLDDIDFGRTIAKAMGGLDVGQTVVVKNKAIVAIEAMEGTDRCIERGGRICREGAVVVKAAKPHQDVRFDVPVVGPRTIKIMAKVRAGCLAVESGWTLVIDRRRCVRMAERAGICLLGF